MTIKLISLSLTFLYTSNLSAHSNDYKIGDTLFVWADNGILVRKQPDINSESIKKLNYGERIVIQEIDERNFEYKIMESVTHQKEVFPGITVAGNFMKISFSGTVGYIYGGFLSRLKPINQGEGLEVYFARVFGQLKILADVRHDNSDNRFKRIIYNNGTTLRQEWGNENWWSHVYFIPDITLREAYLLVNRLVGFEKNYKTGLDGGSTWIETHPIKFESNTIVLQTGAFEQTDISVLPGYAVITMRGGN